MNRKIKTITVLKDGFLLHAQDPEQLSDEKSYRFLLVFNLIKNHNLISYIARYTKGKSKPPPAKPKIDPKIKYLI